MNSTKQIKLGAAISYFTIAFNMISGLIYTPWMISKIGQSNYGLYTLASSLISLLVLDFGIGAAITRFLSKYNAAKDQNAINNFLGLVYKLYLGIDALILLVLTVIFFFIESIYTQLTPSELEIFKDLYIVVAIHSVVSFPFVPTTSIFNAYERFVELKVCELLRKVFIIIAMVIALLSGCGVHALVIVNALSSVITITYRVVVVKLRTPIKINFSFFDKSLLKDVFNFSLWTTISSLAQRLILTITPSIIAMVSAAGSVSVAIFGLATTIESYVFTFANAINGMFMPRISKIIHDGKKDTELLPLMIRIGRIQCMIIGLIIVGFICVGKSFIIHIWNKPDFSESYICAVLLIVPTFFSIPMQIANTTLIVENKVKLNAAVMIATGLLNVCCSFILSKQFGAIGAAMSIFIAYMFSNVALAIIYKKVLKIDVKTFCKETYLKILPYIIVTLVIGLLLEQFNPITNVIIRFTVNGVAVVGVFGVLVLLFYMNKYEKNLLIAPIRKLLRK